VTKYSLRKIRNTLSISDNASTSDLKGEYLEILVKYIFEKVSGIEFLGKNLLDKYRAQEIDIAFWTADTKLSFLGPMLFVECKNTSNPVSSADVRWFIDKLKDKGQRFGVLVALSGITGANDGESNAHNEVLKAVIRDGITVMIISRQEIISIKNTLDLVDLLRKKLLSLILQQTIIID
jgi:hypothetical protein